MLSPASPAQLLSGKKCIILRSFFRQRYSGNVKLWCSKIEKIKFLANQRYSQNVFKMLVFLFGTEAQIAPRWSKDTPWARKKWSFCSAVFCGQISWIFMIFHDFSMKFHEFSWFFIIFRWNFMNFHDFSMISDEISWFFDEISWFFMIFHHFRKSASRGFEPTRDFSGPFTGSSRWWVPLRHRRGCGLRECRTWWCRNARSKLKISDVASGGNLFFAYA